MRKILSDVDLSKIKNIIIENDNVINLIVSEDGETLSILSNE